MYAIFFVDIIEPNNGLINGCLTPALAVCVLEANQNQWMIQHILKGNSLELFRFVGICFK
jgi:hypothetical protein